MAQRVATRRNPTGPRRVGLVAARSAAPYVHPRALVESSTIGAGTRVWAFAHVQAGVRIGADCNIGEQCFVETGVTIGDGVVIKNGVSIWAGVTIESAAFIGPNVAFTNDTRPRSRVYHHEPSRTVVREGASIGANATLLSGLEVGRYALVGAGAVVTKSVPAFTLVIGNPARSRGSVCRCAAPLRFVRQRALCECGRQYRKIRGGIEEARR